MRAGNVDCLNVSNYPASLDVRSKKVPVFFPLFPIRRLFLAMFYFQILIAGFLGGVVRGLVGWTKQRFSSRSMSFSLSYFLGMSFISGVIGMTVALATKELGFQFSGTFSPSLSFIIGYAGGDFVENIYKIIIKKGSWP